ncbi:MAG: M48 family metallopeptidase [Chloroherpetonaceae bacterium]|nr:M48 family metallopeptidase [Chloroherpetonaceae bacterium]
MNRLIRDIAIFLILFFGMWKALAFLDWRAFLKVKEVNESSETHLGELIRKSIRNTEEVITEPVVTKPVMKLISRLTEKNGLDTVKIQVIVVRSSKINAFALPGGFIVVNSRLLKEVQSEAELAGVLAHEMAHIAKRHVMKKLMKELGLAFLLSAASGNNSATEQLGAIAKTLSSSAYDRELETEADETAVTFLENAGINPQGLAEFLYKLKDEDEASLQALSWFSTHPELEERAKHILSLSSEKSDTLSPILTSEEWEKMRAYKLSY